MINTALANSIFCDDHEKNHETTGTIKIANEDNAECNDITRQTRLT